tara:strand:- start:534 stop:791 length:258 start_codon:yes stop_codon:yes gene_type:complete
MSKMGQYVFDLITVEEADFYGHSDRERRADAQADEDTRVAAGVDGDRGLVCSADQCGRSNGDTRPTPTHFPMATGSTAKEILRRS